MSDLVKRLQARRESRYDSKTQGVEWYEDDLCQEAAARILELEAENKKLKEAFERQNLGLHKIAELRYAEDANEPFDEALDLADATLSVTAAALGEKP